MDTTTAPTNAFPAPAGDPIDPLVQQRLARLAARQAGAGAGRAATGAAAATPVQGNRPPAGSNRAKRRHAAKRSRAAALLMSIGTTAGLSAYFQHADAAAADASATPVAVATGSTGAALADGTYVGETDTNKWGPVQVQITVSGGQIAEVTALQTPSDDGKSVQINNRAVPVLNSEALTAQSTDIDTVSGATYTSDSYKVSLQSAIDQAVAAAATASA